MSAHSPRNRYSPVHSLLRQSTHPAHVRLNHHPCLAGLLTKEYRRSDYRHLLRTYHGLYRDIEDAIERFLRRQPGLFDYAPRRKQCWLEADLAFLGDPPPDDASPGEARFPEIARRAELIGVLYVIEGSTLGGQHIARALERHLGLTPDAGARFFSGYGPATPAMWEAFVGFAESIATNCAAESPEDAAADSSGKAASDAATFTFAAFERALDRARPMA